MQFKRDRWKLFLWSPYNFSVLKFIYDSCKFQFSSYKHQLLHCISKEKFYFVKAHFMYVLLKKGDYWIMQSIGVFV